MLIHARVIGTTEKAIRVNAHPPRASGWTRTFWVPRAAVGGDGTLDTSAESGQSGTLELLDWWIDKPDVQLNLGPARRALPNSSLTVKRIAALLDQTIRGVAEQERKVPRESVCECGECPADDPVNWHVEAALTGVADRLRKALSA